MPGPGGRPLRTGRNGPGQALSSQTGEGYNTPSFLSTISGTSGLSQEPGIHYLRIPGSAVKQLRKRLASQALRQFGGAASQGGSQMGQGHPEWQPLFPPLQPLVPARVFAFISVQHSLGLQGKQLQKLFTF